MILHPPTPTLFPYTTLFRSSNAMAFIYYITQVQLDFGAVKLLPQECERSGMRKPLVVTDPGVRAAGVLEIGRAHAELQSLTNLVCRLLLEKKKKTRKDGNVR